MVVAKLLGKRLTLLRKKKELTQDEIAKFLGITRPAYTAYESGKRNPDYGSLQKLADLHNVTIDFLLGREPVYSTPQFADERFDELFKEFSDLPENEQKLVADHWESALSVIRKQQKKEQPAVEEENKEYRTDLDKFTPLGEPDLGQALVKLSEIAYAQKLTDEEFSIITKKLVAHYGVREGGEWAAHGPKLPGQIGRKEDDKSD